MKPLLFSLSQCLVLTGLFSVSIGISFDKAIADVPPKPSCAQVIDLRAARLEDAIGMAALDLKVWGPEMAATSEKFASRIYTFPEGQILALSEGSLLGFINSQKTTSGIDYLAQETTWPKVTGHGFIDETHKPNGKVLFLINLSVDFDSKKIGTSRSSVGARLIQEAFHLAKKEGISRIEGITRLNGFRNYYEIHSKANPIEESELISQYLINVASGELRDPALSFHLDQGAEIVGPIKNAMPKDDDSLEWGALIVYQVH